MSVEDNGLTLEGLAQRLETLERENAALRSKVAELGGSGTRSDGLSETSSLVPRRNGERASGFEGRVSRRSLLSKTGAAAVAAVAAGTFLYPPREAKAETDYFDEILANRVQAATLGMQGYQSSGPGVRGSSESGVGVEGTTKGTGPAVEGTASGGGGTGVKGTGRYGVWGESNEAGFFGVFGRNTNTDGYGVRGVASDEGTGVRGLGGTGVWGSSSRTGYSGVYGQHTGSSGVGVVGDGKGSGKQGVLGRNPDGEGVRGVGSTIAEAAGVRGLGKTGVWGSSAATGYSGLYGQHTGSAGYGVVGDGTGATGAGVIGRNPSGPGVEGRDSVYGGKFAGSRAQLMLKPRGGTAGKPTTGAHAKGEISMDSKATLWVCTVGGTPGTWRKVATTAN